MTEDEFDSAFSRRLKTFSEERSLPPDFSDRLVQSVHRSCLLRRVKLLGVIAALTAVSLLVIGMGRRAPDSRAGETALVAAQTPTSESNVSGWMFLGCIRECFRRSKTGKRKEDE